MEFCYIFTLQYYLYMHYMLRPLLSFTQVYILWSASYMVQSDSQISLIQPGLKVGWMRPGRSDSLGSHLQTN